MKLVETEVDTIFGGPGIHNPNEINPYCGCMFHCAYCFVNGNEDPRQGLLQVKTNAPELVRRDLPRQSRKIAIFLASQTDPYLYAERKYGLTRRCIEEVMQHPEYKISILTKSDLVLRDVDLLKRMRSEVHFSIAILDERVRKILEPNAPPVEKRLEAIEALERNGIPTSVKIKPVLPFGLTPVREIVETVAPLISGSVFVQGLEMAPAFAARVDQLVQEHFPERWRDSPGGAEAREELSEYLRNHERVVFQSPQDVMAKLERLQRES